MGSPLCALLILLTFIAVIAEILVEENVLVLSDDNFVEVLHKYGDLLVEFYAPWCNPCKNLSPEWAMAAKVLEKSPIHLAKVDCNKYPNFAKSYELQGYPTIAYFKQGEFVSEYNGSLTEASIVSWAYKLIGSTSHVVQTIEELMALQAKHPVMVLGLFLHSESENAKKFEELASKDYDHVYAVSFDALIMEKLQIDRDTVFVFKDSEEARSDLDVSSGIDMNLVATFISGHTIPLLFEYSTETAKRIGLSNITKRVYLFVDPNAETYENTMKAIRDLATSYRGQFLFICVPNTETNILEYFGIPPHSLPAAVLVIKESSTMKRYPLSAGFNPEHWSSVLDDYLNGNLPISMKSESVSADDTVGPVMIVKGDSFQQIVINNENDVLISFCAPWSSQCTELEPTWQELGRQYAGSNVIIASMDYTANQIKAKGIVVDSFPTICMFRRGDKRNPVYFEDRVEKEELIKFIGENSRHSPSHTEL